MSALLTSRSRMATMPWEFRLRIWLPATPTNAEWMRQPAIICASSTARWIDCTVDSMLTTTPFFRPRDGCVPIPTISNWPSAVTSPTSATTLEVPISRPTIILPLCTFAILLLLLTHWTATASAAVGATGARHVTARPLA
ncbi:hypothetical protein D9M69_414290 [compost metagenome]